MNNQLKQQWIEALRSGNYQQGTSGLHYDNTFDALGVLLDVIDNTKWEQRGHYWVWVDGSVTSTIRLPMWINDQYNLEVADENQLSQMNDNGWSFADLADWIEQNIPDDTQYQYEELPELPTTKFGPHYNYTEILDDLKPSEFKRYYYGKWDSNP